MVSTKSLFTIFLTVALILYLWVIASFYRYTLINTNSQHSYVQTSSFNILKNHTRKIFRLGVSGVTDFSTFNFNSTMPQLWGNDGKDLGESSLTDRMILLDAWINYLSLDSQLENIKSKTLMIYEGGISRWGENSNRSSKYPKFCRTKCKYLIGPQQMNQADGVLLIRDWFYHSKVSIPRKKLKILSFLESPYASHGNLGGDNTVVASYHRGSDIIIPYGKWISDTKLSNKDTKARNYALGKTKLAAIFTSNCQTTNNRMLYVQTLQEFIPVHVYGACGNLTCPRAESKSCFEMLKRDYKFYLAFENANCRDYITEKLFLNAYENDALPVVFGGHPHDYRALAPPHSYIHVEDFDSPKELASYLKILDSNDTMYNEYFKWKNTGTFYSADNQASTLCRMCAMLHYAHLTNTKPPARETATWSTFDKCLSHGKWYWGKDE